MTSLALLFALLQAAFFGAHPLDTVGGGPAMTSSAKLSPADTVGGGPASQSLSLNPNDTVGGGPAL
jgi:hypothetical protein